MCILPFISTAVQEVLSPGRGGSSSARAYSPTFQRPRPSDVAQPGGSELPRSSTRVIAPQSLGTQLWLADLHSPFPLDSCRCRKSVPFRPNFKCERTTEEPSILGGSAVIGGKIPDFHVFSCLGRKQANLKDGNVLAAYTVYAANKNFPGF